MSEPFIIGRAGDGQLIVRIGEGIVATITDGEINLIPRMRDMGKSLSSDERCEIYKLALDFLDKDIQRQQAILLYTNEEYDQIYNAQLTETKQP